MLRAIDKPVPKNGAYPGGTGAWLLTYRDALVPVKLSEVERGDVLFRPFRYAGPKDQGHWSVALGGADDLLLQSYLAGGCDRKWTARQSHDGGYYIYRIPREAIWN